MLEGYQDAIGASNTIGNFTITFIILVLSEDWLIYTFSDGYFLEPTPTYIVVLAIITAFIVFVGFPLVWFGLLKRGKTKQG
jgi:hypothetical protein